MCGFFQVIQRNKPIDRERFRIALASMSHRGPDQSGELFKEIEKPGQQPLYLAFGHQRLSIIDLSEKSRQPYAFDENVLLFNGEIYNYQELNPEVARQGATIRTDGDTDTAFNLLGLRRESALADFNGMWAISMYYGADNKVLLTRDRYGKKPLFYYIDENTFCASSTIRAIQLYLGRKITFNRQSMLNYLVFNEQYPSGTSETHFNDINQILPGHAGWLNLNNWRIEQHPYFSFYDENQIDTPSDPELLVELLKDSVRKRLISDRPIALLLSGGVDSSLILSTLISLGMQDQCHIYMGDAGRSNDYKYAEACVKATGIRAETVKLDYDQNTFERFLKVCQHQERPVSLNGSSMGMPQMYETIASHGIPVVLDGTGGDELFGGYWQRQQPYAAADALKARQWAWLMQELRGAEGDNRIGQYLLRTFAPGLHASRQGLSKRLKAILNPMLNADFGSLMATHPTDPLTNPHMSFTQALCRDTAPGGRLHEWLWHNDRNAMMSSIEGRSPLLDYRLNRFIYTSYQEKFSGPWNKLELRKAFDKLTPLPTQWRKEKQGFRWDGKHFLSHNHAKITELIRHSQDLSNMGLVDTSKLADVVNKQPKLLKSTFVKQVMTVAAIEHAFSSY